MRFESGGVEVVSTLPITSRYRSSIGSSYSPHTSSYSSSKYSSIRSTSLDRSSDRLSSRNYDSSSAYSSSYLSRPPRPSIDTYATSRRTLDNLRGSTKASLDINSSSRSSPLRLVIPRQYSRGSRLNCTDAYGEVDNASPVLTRYRDLNSSPYDLSTDSLDNEILSTRRPSLYGSRTSLIDADSVVHGITASIRVRPPSPNGDSSSVSSLTSSDNSDNSGSLSRRRKRFDSNANLCGIVGSALDDDDSGVGSTSGSRPSSRTSNSSAGVSSRFIRRSSSPTLGSLTGAKSTPGVLGLRNLGNTCFMNTVIQCLSNTKALQQYCVKERYMSDINTTISPLKGALIKTFSSLLLSIWKNVDGESSINPLAFKNQIQKFAPRFVGYDQQDAQEFLRYLLQGIHEDVNRVTIRPRSLASQLSDDLSDKQKATQSWNRYLRYDDSKIVDLFVGQLKSTLKCTVCGHMSVTFDPFWDLSLPIPKTVGQVSVQQCLNLFTKEETLEGDEKPTCAKCKERRRCTKSLTIWKFPRILVLHLKRFSPHERFRAKLSSTVNFPINNLDLSPYSSDGSRGQNLVYNLYAVSNHSGSTYSGHYTAYCKHPTVNTWNDFNDSRVTEIKEDNLVTSEAYVLFYESASEISRL